LSSRASSCSCSASRSAFLICVSRVSGRLLNEIVDVLPHDGDTLRIACARRTVYQRAVKSGCSSMNAKKVQNSDETSMIWRVALNWAGSWAHVWPGPVKVHSTVWPTSRYFALIGGSLPMTDGIDGKAR
jgi:hypothetical protein